MKQFFTVLLLSCTSLFAVGDPITLVSYNIRYDASGDQGAKDWKQRKGTVTKYLLKTQASIIGLQEVLHSQLLDIKQAMPSHTYVGVGRDDAKQRGEYSPIFYDHKVWELDNDDHGTFWLSDTPAKPGSKSWGNSIPRICTWARLINRNGKGIYIFNTHWDHRSKSSRIKSAKLILERIRSRKNPRDPYLLMGDLNADNKSPAVQELLNSGFLIDHGGKNFKTFNQWQSSLLPGQRIDHILTSPKLRHGKFHIDTNGNPPGSDHHPVRLHISIKH